MNREIAVLGDELASELVSQGFEALWSKEGRLCRVYYFHDTEELLEALERLLAREGY